MTESLSETFRTVVPFVVSGRLLRIDALADAAKVNAESDWISTRLVDVTHAFRLSAPLS
jgi:hypothetical protein